MSAKKGAELAQSVDPAMDGTNPLLEKIKATLSQTKSSQWTEYGAKFDTHKKYPKMTDRVEHFYVLEIKAGYLIVRCSVGVMGQFHNGGYTLTPTSAHAYTIEFRDRTWDARTLADPTHHQKNSNLVKSEVFATGETAHALFEQVSHQVTSHVADKKREFEMLAADLMKGLEELATAGITDAWEKRVEHKGAVTWYRATIEGLRVDVGRQSRTAKDRDNEAYRIVVADKQGMTRHYDNALAKRLYEALDTYDRNEGLMRLDDLLNRPS